MIWLIAFFLAAEVGYVVLVLIGLRRIREPEPAGDADVQPISVVVAARDESLRIGPLLEALARQSARVCEFVIVDDGSDDDTAEHVLAWSRRDPRFRLISAPVPSGPRKKSALAAGISAARGPLIALTDADCRPPATWLARLATLHATFPGSVLVGYGPLRRRPGMLNRLIRYETVRTALLTAASIGLRRPYMAVGRNLSYRKSLFEAGGGFSHSHQSLSGDDDLLIQHVARHRLATIRYVTDPATFVPAEPPATWGAWLRQKRRHASAGRFYDPGILAHLALWHGSGLMLWIAPLMLGAPGLAFLAAHLGLQFLLLKPAARQLGESDLVPLFPFLEAAYAVLPMLTALAAAVKMPKKW